MVFVFAAVLLPYSWRAVGQIVWGAFQDNFYRDEESHSTRSPTAAQYNKAVLWILLKKQKTGFNNMPDWPTEIQADRVRIPSEWAPPSWKPPSMFPPLDRSKASENGNQIIITLNNVFSREKKPYATPVPGRCLLSLPETSGRHRPAASSQCNWLKPGRCPASGDWTSPKREVTAHNPETGKHHFEGQHGIFAPLKHQLNPFIYAL